MGEPSGWVAPRPADIRIFLAAAGLEDADEDVDLTDPDFVEWRGAGPEAWAPLITVLVAKFRQRLVISRLADAHEKWRR
ncbi:hypothetical protein [Streptomyces virginiae]|uniref:hypothetical protein n=1 Tax=Streptomyces virginiae TaxID=1961 RepID=UPI0036557C3C